MSKEVEKMIQGIQKAQNADKESILPNFHFSGFLNFAVKLESLLHMKKMCELYNGQA